MGVDAAAFFNSSFVGLSDPKPNLGKSNETYASEGGALASLGGAGGALASVVDVSLSGSESEPSSEA